MIRHPWWTWMWRVYDRLVLAVYTFFVTLAVTGQSFFGQQRMSHENGIALSGRLKVVDNPTFPAHNFFRPGLEFSCRMRHGSASFKDDAKLVVRSASLKFQDDQFDSPFDLMMNSGDMPLFWNARTFVEFMWVTLRGRGKQFVSYLKKYPVAQVGGGSAVRRNPDSFGDMVYQTKTALGFVGTDGVFRYVRYKIEPLGFEQPEGGLPDDFDRNHPWLQNPYRNEKRNRNYLKEQLRQRLNLDQEPLHYMLMMQLREKPVEALEPQWLSCAVPWDATETPWHSVAEIQMVRALNYERSMLTWFDMGNHPDSLPVPKAVSIDDPHSLNHLRLASIWARHARLFSYRIWGIPAAVGDARKDADWVGVPPLKDPPGDSL